MAYAEDLSGAGKLTDIKEWWRLVNNNGLKIGYLPNAAKSILILKPELYDCGTEIFHGSGVTVTKDG